MAMKKSVLIIFLFLTSAINGFSQSKTDDAIMKQIKNLKADKIFVLSYDSSSNFSKILGFSEDFGKEQNARSDLSAFRFGLAFFFPGKTLSVAPVEYLLTFQAQAKKPKFAAAHSLKFTIDDEILDLGDARYAAKGDTEYLNFKLDREQLGKLAKGENIRMKIGNAEFILNAGQIKMFADLFALSEPSN